MKCSLYCLFEPPFSSDKFGKLSVSDASSTEYLAYPLCISYLFSHMFVPEKTEISLQARVDASPLPQSSLLMCPFLLAIPLNVLFLKEVTNNVHENQQAKSRAN